MPSENSKRLRKKSVSKPQVGEQTNAKPEKEKKKSSSNVVEQENPSITGFLATLPKEPSPGERLWTLAKNISPCPAVALSNLWTAVRLAKDELERGKK